MGNKGVHFSQTAEHTQMEDQLYQEYRNLRKKVLMVSSSLANNCSLIS